VTELTQSSLDRYNRLFNNIAFRSISAAIAEDLKTHPDHSRVTDLMNVVTDAALGLSGYPHYPDGWLKLAIMCAQNELTVGTVDSISQYLRIFQQAHDTYADDFALTAKALLKLHEATTGLNAATACANGIHNAHGRTAYDLLAAAELLTRAATIALEQDDPHYMMEKARAAQERIGFALRENLRIS
jgi:hypothetical protein